MGQALPPYSTCTSVGLSGLLHQAASRFPCPGTVLPLAAAGTNSGGGGTCWVIKVSQNRVGGGRRIAKGRGCKQRAQCDARSSV